MERIMIYRVKAIDNMFESVWFTDKKICKRIIKNIESDPIQRMVCGSKHIIEMSELGV